MKELAQPNAQSETFLNGKCLTEEPEIGALKHADRYTQQTQGYCTCVNTAPARLHCGSAQPVAEECALKLRSYWGPTFTHLSTEAKGSYFPFHAPQVSRTTELTNM